MIKKQKFALLGLLSLLALSGCDAGDDRAWEAQKWVGVPYTEERTAGTGFKWVLVALAPRKGAVLEPIMEQTEAIIPAKPAVKISKYVPLDYNDIQKATPIADEPEVKDAAPIFEDANQK